MTDNEIIKALECCVSDGYTCPNCPYEYDKHIVDDEFETMPNGKSYDDYSCDEWLKLDLFALINRQRAEIERLQAEIIRLKNKNSKLRNERNRARAEAIKEFAERLKHKYVAYSKTTDGLYSYNLSDDDIDNLVK